MKKSKTNKAWKRAAAGALSVALVAGSVPANVGGFLTGGQGIVMSAAAEDAVPEVTVTSVDSAETLATAVQNGGSVQLTADITLTSTLNITNDVTIDLNGNNITATDVRAIQVKSGKLTLTGTGIVSSSGTVDVDSSVIRVGDGKAPSENKVDAKLVIGKDVTITTDKCYGVTVFGGSTTETVDIYGKVNVTGTRCALSGNGNAYNAGTTINIYSGAEITATQNVAIYHPQAGDLNITGGAIRGLGGIEAKAGTSNVSITGSDTIIEATATQTSHVANNNGTSTRGYAIAAVENSGYAGSPLINISGGNIIGPVDLVKDNAVVDEKKGSISITGGIFTVNPGDYLADGYTATASDNNYVVKGLVSIVNTDYASLQAAINAAENGDTVTLNADITLSSQVNLETGKKITLNLNGKSISAIDSRAIWVKNGDLSITGTGTISSYKTEGSAFGDSSSVIRVGDNSAAAVKLDIGAGVTVYSNHCYGVTVFGSTIETVDIRGKVNVDGTASAISGNGNDKDAATGTTINIYPGAEVTAANDVAIYHPQAGTLNITGGTISGLGGIEAKAGTVNISGSPTIVANGEISHEPYGNGTSTRGYAVSAVNNAGYAGSVAFNISGGTLTGSVAVLDDNAVADAKKGSISITGGKFVDAKKAKQDVSGYFTADYAQDDYGYVREISAICWDEINDTTGKTYYNVSPKYLTVYDGETVKLRKAVTTNRIYIQNGDKGSIDLNGYDLTLDGYGFVGYNSTENEFADLTIKNTGAAATLNGIKTNSQAFNIADYSKLTVGERVTLTSAAAWTVVPYAYTTLDVYGTITNTYNLGGDSGYAISGNHNWSMGTVINIYKGAEVSAPYGNAIYQPHDGTLNITGGTVSGKTAIYARTGNINISGGTLTANGASVTASEVADGADPTGDALAIQSHASYGVPVVRISGGNFSSTNGKSVASYTVNNTAIPDISITGGTFSDILDTTFIANEYVQNEDKAVVKPELKDISKYVKLTLDDTSFSYDGSTKSVDWNVILADDVNLEYEKDYIIEGDTVATNVGTYVVKLKGTGEYKGEVTATWSITDQYTVRAYSQYAVEGDKQFGDTGRVYSFGQSATFTAPEVSGKKFSHWATSYESDAKVLSTSSTYSFIVKGSVDVYAIYVDDNEEVEQQAVLELTTFKSIYNGKNAVGFDFTHSIPEGCTVKEVGLLYGTNKLAGANTGVLGYAKKNLKTDGSSVGVSDLASALKSRSTVKKYVANYKKNNGTLRFSYALGNANNDAYANAIGYVTYVDENNKTVTVYSDAMAACYNTAG